MEENGEIVAPNCCWAKLLTLTLTLLQKLQLLFIARYNARYHNHKYTNTHNTAGFMIRILLINHNKGWNMITLSHSLPWNSIHYCNDWVLTLALVLQSLVPKLWQNVKILFIITVWPVSVLSPPTADCHTRKWICVDKNNLCESERAKLN